MKKILFLISLVSILVFFSCSSDDDGAKSNCESCTSDAGNEFEICDNGDETYTISENGVSETFPKEELAGLPIKLVVESICDSDLEF